VAGNLWHSEPFQTSILATYVVRVPDRVHDCVFFVCHPHVVMAGSLVLLLLSAASLSVAELLSGYVVKETHHVPRGWTNLGPAPGHAKLAIRIGLKQAKWDELERHLYEVSDPFHPRYGQHLSREEVDQLVKPAESTLTEVHNWLNYSGYSDRLEYSAAKDWIKLSLSVTEAELLLDTEYSTYRHEDGTYYVHIYSYRSRKRIIKEQLVNFCSRY